MLFPLLLEGKYLFRWACSPVDCNCLNLPDVKYIEDLEVKHEPGLGFDLLGLLRELTVTSLHGDLSDQWKDKADTLVSRQNAVDDEIVDAVFPVVISHNLRESDYH